MQTPAEMEKKNEFNKIFDSTHNVAKHENKIVSNESLDVRV